MSSTSWSWSWTASTVPASRRFWVEGAAAIIKAVCEEPIALPSSVAPDCPKAIDAICARALERERERRYQTAAQLRAELVSAVRALEPDRLPEQALAELLTELF